MIDRKRRLYYNNARWTKAFTGESSSSLQEKKNGRRRLTCGRLFCMKEEVRWRIQHRKSCVLLRNRMWSLSGWPSVTDSDVKRNLSAIYSSYGLTGNYMYIAVLTHTKNPLKINWGGEKSFPHLPAKADGISTLSKTDGCCSVLGPIPQLLLMRPLSFIYYTKLLKNARGK